MYVWAYKYLWGCALAGDRWQFICRDPHIRPSSDCMFLYHSGEYIACLPANALSYSSFPPSASAHTHKDEEIGRAQGMEVFHTFHCTLRVQPLKDARGLLKYLMSLVISWRVEDGVALAVPPGCQMESKGALSILAIKMNGTNPSNICK